MRVVGRLYLPFAATFLFFFPPCFYAQKWSLLASVAPPFNLRRSERAVFPASSALRASLLPPPHLHSGTYPFPPTSHSDLGRSPAFSPSARGEAGAPPLPA